MTLKKERTQRLVKAIEGECLDSATLSVGMRLLPTLKYKVTTYEGDRIRKFSEVILGGKGYLADRSTGTLYDFMGKCLSTDQLRIVSKIAVSKLIPPRKILTSDGRLKEL